MSGEESGERQTLVNTGFSASIHVSTFYFKGADKGRIMLIGCPKCPLLAYFDLVLVLWGVREYLTARPFTSTAAADRPRVGMPEPLATLNNI